ncbi:MAG: FecR domain-containing protein [Spirochaetes bacterium]|nr:FecR domain-containing protein [Spirochaetota bacterium]
MNRKLLLSIAAALVAISALSAEGGKLTFVIGRVDIDKGSGWKKAAAKTALDEADKIRTGANSTAIIHLKSGATLKLKAHSQVTLQSIGNATVVDVSEGAVFSKINRREANQTFQIRAQTIVAAVRGTQFYFTYGKRERDNAKADLWLCVNEGKVNVTDSATASNVNVNAGEGIIIPTDKKIPKPKPFEWTKKLNWNMDAAQGDVVDKTTLKGAYRNLERNNYD